MSPKGPKRSRSSMFRVGSFIIVGAVSAGLLAGCGVEKAPSLRGRQYADFHLIDAGR